MGDTTIRGMDQGDVRVSRSSKYPRAVELQAGCSFALLNPKGIKQLATALLQELVSMELEFAAQIAGIETEGSEAKR